jgi:predicted negative regulator of RcsB-dependent stress response
MSTSSRPQAAPDRRQTFVDWLQLNTGVLSIAGAVVILGVIAFWFIHRSAQIKETNASKALSTAKSSLASGNQALALSDLQRVVDRWPNTGAGMEAAMTLATLDYDQGKFQDGIKILEKETQESNANVGLSALYSLIGDGYAQLKKLPDAAKAYERAAQAAEGQKLKGDAAYQKSKAARTFVAAGDTAQGRRLWSELAKSDMETVAAEARVRIGELSAFGSPKS